MNGSSQGVEQYVFGITYMYIDIHMETLTLSVCYYHISAPRGCFCHTEIIQILLLVGSQCFLQRDILVLTGTVNIHIHVNTNYMPNVDIHNCTLTTCRHPFPAVNWAGETGCSERGWLFVSLLPPTFLFLVISEWLLKTCVYSKWVGFTIICAPFPDILWDAITAVGSMNKLTVSVVCCLVCLFACVFVFPVLLIPSLTLCVFSSPFFLTAWWSSFSHF